MKLITLDDLPICTADDNKTNAYIFNAVKEGYKPSEIQIAKSMEFMRMTLNGKNRVVKIQSIPHLD